MEPFQIRRTGDADYPKHLKVLVLGPPKSGKTTFLGSVPNIVIADTEPDANGLMSIAHRNVPYVTVDEPDKLQSLLFVLRDESMRAKAAEQMGLPAIEAVGIDTLDALQEMLKKDRLRTERRTAFQRDDWGWLKDKLREIVKAFTALPLHVIFTVHTKTIQDDEDRIIQMPGLQGSIAEEIAGMVGYSLLSNRSREVKPDGTPYTKYSLRVEGDDKNPHLGNRAAGRLPEIMEPNFGALFTAAIQGLDLQPSASVTEINAGGQPTAVGNPPAEPQPAAQVSGQAGEGTPPPPSDDDQPITEPALKHLRKLLAEQDLQLSDDAKGWTLGYARSIARYIVGFKQDAAAGKGGDRQELIDHLIAAGALTDPMGEQQPAETDGGQNSQAQPEPEQAADQGEPQVEPKLDGTIQEVIAYVGDDPAKAQEAYDAEQGRSRPRSTLIQALEAKGAQPKQVETPPADADDEEQPGGEVTREQAVANIKEGLGATEISPSDPDASRASNPEEEPCENCGNEIDDLDIARLSKTRFRRWLCVGCYVNATKAKSA